METSEVVTAIVAGYAAVVATAALGWQIYTWRRARRPRIDVQVRGAVAGLPTGPQTGYSIEVVNRGEQSVRVSSVGFDLPDGQQLVLFPNQINDLPGTVNAGDAASAFAAKDKLPTEVGDPPAGFAQLSTGERFTSAKRRRSWFGRRS